SLGVSMNQIRLVNDAASFWSGEILAGAGKGYDHAIGLTLGTGLGSATYHQHIVKDADRWHTPFREGIAEDYLSTRWFEREVENRTQKLGSGEKKLAEMATTHDVGRRLIGEFGATLRAV